MRVVNAHAAEHMTARSFSFCHGADQCRHETRRGGTTGSMADFGVRTDSHAGLIRDGLKPPSFPSFGRDYEGAVVGEQSVRLSPATARRENPHPFEAKPQPPNHEETEVNPMRKRNHVVPIRFSDHELLVIDANAKRANMSRTEFLVSAGMNKPIVILDDLKPMLAELRRIGNNVNQLTRKANSGEIYCVNLSEFSKQLGEVASGLYTIQKEVDRLSQR